MIKYGDSIERFQSFWSLFCNKRWFFFMHCVELYSDKFRLRLCLSNHFRLAIWNKNLCIYVILVLHFIKDKPQSQRKFAIKLNMGLVSQRPETACFHPNIRVFVSVCFTVFHYNLNREQLPPAFSLHRLALYPTHHHYHIHSIECYIIWRHI